MKEILLDEKKLAIRSDEVDVIKQSKLVRGVIYELQQVVEANNYPALAAINIGLPYRIFIINFNGDLRTFINPVVVETKGQSFSRETNPSIEGQFVVGRFNEITVMYQTPKGKVENKKLIGAAAYMFQQCMDSLEGVFISDVGFEIDDDWDELTDDEKVEIIKTWCKIVGDRIEDNQAHIDADPELKKMQDALKFDESVAKGETIVEEVPMTPEEIAKLKEEEEKSKQEETTETTETPPQKKKTRKKKEVVNE